jgi:cell division septum initiation protein DivIVA
MDDLNVKQSHSIDKCEESKFKNHLEIQLRAKRKLIEELNQKNKVIQTLTSDKDIIAKNYERKVELNKELEKEILEFKEKVEQGRKINFSLGCRNLKQKCEEFEAIIKGKDEKIEKLNKQIINLNNSFETYVMNTNQYVNRWKNESKDLKEELRKVYNSWKEDKNKANCLELQYKKLSQEKDNMSENLKSIKLEMRKIIEIFSQQKLELTEILDQERKKIYPFKVVLKIIII